MIGGILIGIGVTALAFFIVMLLRKGESPSPIALILTVVMLAALCIEGVMMNGAIKLKNNTSAKMALIQETVYAYLPTKGQDYTITAEQASAIRLGMSLVLPSLSDYFGTDDLAGKTVKEAIDTLCLSLEQAAAKQVRKFVWLFVITAVVATLLLFFAYGFGGSVSLPTKGRARGGRGGGANAHRAPRRVHR